ncbi:MAG: serine/threonine protein phosphatase [Verrucomicrobia bacterium]|nr:serine/threonine protein phosphatase [Verrucomicrobiota bacterium]
MFATVRWKRRALVGALGLALLPGPVLTAAPVEGPSYATWTNACARLPSNRQLGAKRPPKALLPLATVEPLEKVLDAFFGLMTNGPMAAPAHWVGPAPGRESFFNVQRGWFTPPEIPFEPFVRKWVLPANHRVVVMGDLHGDIRSLLTVLDALQQRRWLEGFRVIEPGLHLAFLGDYTDRGQYGVEVLYTLLRLKEANPDRVHMVRGNHEDLSLVARYGFLAEIESKYGRALDPFRILRAYDFLPAALYLGSGAQFVQLCHGGMEPGYDPVPLLSAPPEREFQLLGILRQASFLRSNAGVLGGDAASAAAAGREYQDFQPTAPTTPTVIGFLWNDFTVFSDEPAFLRNPDRAYVYGQPAVRTLLEHASRGGPRVHAVIRAHQHSGVPNPMMRRLMASRGLFRHWQEPQSAAAALATPKDLATRLEAGPDRAIPEGSVWTLNVSPDSVYGIGCGFTTATFAVLQLAERFEDWRIAVETVEVP